MPNATWHVYVVECSDRSLYTGVAKDVATRVSRHNQGMGARYTRTRLPVRLVHMEIAANHGAALRREHQIKKMPSAAKRRLIGTA